MSHHVFHVSRRICTYPWFAETLTASIIFWLLIIAHTLATEMSPAQCGGVMYARYFGFVFVEPQGVEKVTLEGGYFVPSLV